MRPLVGLTIALLAAGCAGDTTEDSGTTVLTVPTPIPSTSPHTSLRISVWPEGVDGPMRQWSVDCPGGGNLPDRARACGLLARRARSVFAALPSDVACTEIYGGPQIASVSGRFRGRPVAARFSRRNGCEIARWDRLQFLFPTA